MKPEIITICGSTRFADLMACISWEYEKLGKIVLRVNYLPDWYGKKMGHKDEAHWAEQEGLKKQLDELHCRKIDISDKVFVSDHDGYIGESTSNEITYARKVGKPIYYLNSGTRDNEINDIAQRLTRWWIDANETGLTPRQLADEFDLLKIMFDAAGQKNKELTEVLGTFMAYYESDFIQVTAKDGRTLASILVKMAKALKTPKQ